MTTITNEQIKALRTAAGMAGDFSQVAICCRALGDDFDDVPGSAETIARARAMTQDEARAECARVAQ